MARRYTNPPAIEALCEFRFDPTSPWDMALPGLMYAKLKESYPQRRSGKSIEFELTGQKGSLHAADRIQFLGDQQKDIIQVGPHLLAVNRLAPYSSWQEFLPKIKNAIDVYRNVGSPKGIHRIGLKYVNRFEFPLPTELKDYFDFYPFLGEKLPQNHGPFFCGIEFKFDDDRDRLRLELQMGAPSKENHCALLLVLDYFSTESQKVAFESLDDWLGEAHKNVEMIFEGCLKDSTRKLHGIVSEES